MKKSALCFALICLLCGPVRANMIMEGGKSLLKVFYTMTDRVGWFAVLKGKIISFSSKQEFDAGDLSGKVQDKSEATVRLYNPDGINAGDTIYVINDKNLIVAKMTVRTLFKSTSFGYMLVGYGNFRLSSIDDRVVQKAGDENARFAYIYKARGDYYDNTGKKGEAIREYKNALKVDKNNPAAHLALGLVYMKEGMNQFAMKEFHEGYENMGRLYDNDDRFTLLKSIAQIRFKEIYESFVPEKLKEKYRDEGIKMCREALVLNPQSETVNYLLGMFYYRSSKPDDKAARDYFLKVIDINPSSVEAYIALSELYTRHDNMEKARLYAEKALEADPSSARAQKMLKYIETKTQEKR